MIDAVKIFAEHMLGHEIVIWNKEIRQKWNKLMYIFAYSGDVKKFISTRGDI